MGVPSHSRDRLLRLELFTRDWLISSGLSSAQRASQIAALAALFTHNCSPCGDEQVFDREHQQVAQFLAIFLVLDDRDTDQQVNHDMFAQIFAVLLNQPLQRRVTHPVAIEVRRLLSSLSSRASSGAFAAAWVDHLRAVQEEQEYLDTGEATETRGCDLTSDVLRLRPLLIATEVNIRLWLAVRDWMPSQQFLTIAESSLRQGRRAHAHPALDLTLDAAMRARARSGSAFVRVSRPLTELEALGVVLTYVANDIGSIDFDRVHGGPPLGFNLVLNVEQHLIDSTCDACVWHQLAPSPRPADSAIAIATDLYNTGISRLATLERLASRHDAHGENYAALVGNMVDGNLQSTIQFTVDQDTTKARYGSLEILENLRFAERGFHVPGAFGV